MNLFIFICQQTLIFLVPLLLVGLGDLFSERSGVLNIALEGSWCFGAFAVIMFSARQVPPCPHGSFC